MRFMKSILILFVAMVLLPGVFSVAPMQTRPDKITRVISKNFDFFIL